VLFLLRYPATNMQPDEAKSPQIALPQVTLLRKPTARAGDRDKPPSGTTHPPPPSRENLLPPVTCEFTRFEPRGLSRVSSGPSFLHVPVVAYTPDSSHSRDRDRTAGFASFRSFTRESERGPRRLTSERADLLRQFDATFATKVVPPNLAGLQSGRFAFMVSADLDNPGGH
jgi:hypothetical protein